MSKQAILGWREWIELPDLGLPLIKAKIDTGARTSCLHAFELTIFQRDGQDWVSFKVHPDQQDTDKVVACEAKVFDRRPVRDSGGHTEDRFVILTTLRVGQWADKVEMTLTARDDMRFRVLMGRTSISKAGYAVDPSLSYAQGIKKRVLKNENSDSVQK